MTINGGLKTKRTKNPLKNLHTLTRVVNTVTLWAMAATTAHLKLPTKPIKIKRRRRRETTITTNPSAADRISSSTAADRISSSTAADAHISPNQSQSRLIDTPIVAFSPENNLCSAASAIPPHPPPPEATDTSPLPPFSSSDLKIRYSPSTMGTTTTTSGGTAQDSLHKFNSALTAGLLNPMSPPPPPDKTRSSPTLFEMMANEPDCYIRGTNVAENGVVSAPIHQSSKLYSNPLPQDKQASVQQRLMELLALRSPGNHFNDVGSGDVKLTLSSKDGVSVSVSVHRQILVAHSRFFALKLNEKWVKLQRNSGPYSVEIADCDDIEVYIKTLMLMYCKDLRKKLMKEDVPRILATLKVSAAIGFDAGVLTCLEYLEAAPWTEDEEEKVASLLLELRLEGAGAAEVLKRVSLDTTPGSNDSSDNDEVLLKLLRVVLEGKDEKARREMKTLVTKMLRENSSHNDLRKESLYFACDNCLKSLHTHFLEAAEGDMRNVSQIARQADNLHWLLDVLIDRQIGEDFLRTWVTQFELSEAHCKVGALHRYEVSRVTARLFVGIGKRELLASKEDRCLLLQTWLEPFYEDFGWMKRASSSGLDRHLIEDGLSNTILTLPMSWQKDILMSWFDRFVNCGDDCPNLKRGFAVWWRRAFVRRNGEAARAREVLVASENS